MADRLVSLWHERIHQVARLNPLDPALLFGARAREPFCAHQAPLPALMAGGRDLPGAYLFEVKLARR
jgi:hypothetical protein